MFLVLEYIKYRWKAKGRHGTHSPFVYDFVDRCLTLKIPEEFVQDKKRYFNDLKNDQSILTIEDHGAGSKYLSNKRKVSDIFKTSSSRGKYGDLLYKISRHYEPKNVLELGTSLGIGTLYLSKGNPGGQINTIEGCKETHHRSSEAFQKNKLSNVNSNHSRFKEFLEEYNGEKFDLVFVDGHHDGTALLNYLEILKPHSHADTVFILDDIRWSQSMFEAWEKLQSSEFYHLTMDLFRMGIIVQRPQQEKQHFTIKL